MPSFTSFMITAIVRETPLTVLLLQKSFKLNAQDFTGDAIILVRS
jgi:hypothetical protein